MENKDNVYEEISTAGQGVEEKSPLGKFKDVNALMQAYNSLQAEFTRRSQRLKLLERAGKPTDEKAVPCTEGGEKIPVEAQKQGWQGLDEGTEPDTQGLTTSQTVATKDGTDAEGADVKTSVEASGKTHTDGGAKETPCAEELYRLASKDEKVRLQIVGDYLQSLTQKGAPISKGGVGALLSSPKKAQSIRDAGNMALRLFTDANENQFER